MHCSTPTFCTTTSRTLFHFLLIDKTSIWHEGMFLSYTNTTHVLFTYYLYLQQRLEYKDERCVECVAVRNVCYLVRYKVLLYWLLHQGKHLSSIMHSLICKLYGVFLLHNMSAHYGLFLNHHWETDDNTRRTLNR